MTGAAQGVAGLAVALGFALVGARRTGGVALLCAAQAVVVASGALAQGDAGVAVVELVEAGLLAWWGAGLPLPLPLRASAAAQAEDHESGPWRMGPSPVHPSAGGELSPADLSTRGELSPAHLLGSSPPHISMRWGPSPAHASTGVDIAYGSLASAALLAALAATIPGAGLALAVVLLGLLLVASRPLASQQALGVAAMQNGLVLAAVSTGLSHGRLALVAVPFLPALALGALWLGSDRARTALLRAPRPAGWLDAGLCGLALLLACALPWELGARGPFWRIDALAAHAILLLTALAAAGSWARRDTAPVWGSRLAVLAGTMLSVASTAPLQSMLGMTLATAGAVAAALPARVEAWRRVCLGCTGLGLALFGTIGLLGAPVGLLGAPPALPATACVMLGYGALAVLAPELTIASVILIVRMRGAATGDLLLALGLAALLVAALGLATQGRQRGTLLLYGLTQGRQRGTLPLLGLGQGGAAVFAFGLGTEAGNLAGLLQLSFLALSQCALLLARRDGMDRLAALAGLGGVPPFGLFPSLALILAATAARTPWLLLPLGAGLAAIAWAVLLQLPPERRLLASPAWVPLALLLIAGFAMPDPMLAWFRLAAR